MLVATVAATAYFLRTLPAASWTSLENAEENDEDDT
jgi:hypothetical protein